MALTDSLPTITAYSNDVSYECFFAEQLKNFETIAFTGRDGGKLGPLGHLDIQVSDPHMGRIIEDMHTMVLHMISYCFMDAEKPDNEVPAK